MLKSILYFLLPFLKPGIHKIIEKLVLLAEKIYGSKTGDIKKSYVIEQINKYLVEHPEIKADLVNKFNKDIDFIIDKLVEEAVKKLA